MTKKELESLKCFNASKMITIDDLVNQNDRTVLYGYNCDSATWHVYIKDKEIRICKYYYKDTPTIVIIDDIYDYVPDKRLYPECCDFEFCSLLRKHNIDLPFTTYNENRPKSIYYGAII